MADGPIESGGILEAAQALESKRATREQQWIEARDRRNRFIEAWNDVRRFVKADGMADGAFWEEWESRVLNLGKVLKSEGLDHHLESVTSEHATDIGSLAFQYAVKVFDAAVHGDREKVAERMFGTLPGAGDKYGRDFTRILNDSLRREVMERLSLLEWAPDALNPTCEQPEPAAPVNDVEPGGNGPPKDVEHTPDFRSVRWGDEAFTFTPIQAQCVKVLFESRRARMSGIGQREILDGTESSADRLRDVFRRDKTMHPAWGRMIVQADGKGLIRLAEPCESVA